MWLCDATFEPGDPSVRGSLQDAVEILFGALQINGQVWGPQTSGWAQGHWRVSCSVPRRDSIHERHHSDRVRRELSEVAALCSREPQFFVHPGDSAGPQGAPWRDASSLYVFTHLFDRTSPVNTDRGDPVPHYLLPLNIEIKEGLHRWMQKYQSLDKLWLDSGHLEMAAHEQLASPRSELSREGRRLAAKVEDATGLPTYYALMRYRGRHRREAERLCHECKAPWRVTPRDVDSTHLRGIERFEFRCEACRLLSELAVSDSLP